MLFKNDELIRLDDENSTDPLVKMIREQFEEIQRNYNFPIRIKTRFGTRINKSGHKEPTQSIMAPYDGDYMTKAGVKVRIRYSKGTPIRRPNGRMEYVENAGEVVERSMVIGKDEIDKAWYMLYVCPVVKKGLMKVENKQKEAEAELKSLGNMAVVNYLLTDETSELAKDYDRIRTIALSFGVPNADDEKKFSIEEVKLKLIRNIGKGEASKDPIINVKGFKESVNIPLITQKRALVQQAMDKGVLVFNGVKYYWAVIIGDVERKILDIDAESYGQKEDFLVKHLMNNDNARELFDKAMGRHAAFAGKQEFTAAEIDGMLMHELRSRCQEVGIPAFGAGRTLEVLKKDLKEHYNV